MNSKIRTEKTFTLEMNQSEAVWLKALVQNYFGDPDEESDENRDMRQKIWNCLTEKTKASTIKVFKMES